MASEEHFNSDYLSEPETNNSLSSQFPHNQSFPYPGNVTIILQGSLHYNVFEIVFLAIIMTAMIIVIVIGNMLVVIAIFTENNLKSVQVSIPQGNLSRRQIVKARPFDKSSKAIRSNFLGLTPDKFYLTPELVHRVLGHRWYAPWLARDAILVGLRADGVLDVRRDLVPASPTIF